MTRNERHTTNDSWGYYRAAFRRRSRHFPAMAVFAVLIDRICERGYSEQLYAGESLDNLVISLRPKPRDRRQTILVIPKGDAVEFRFYAEEGEAEVCTVALNQMESVLYSLLPRLVASRTTSISEATGGDTEA